MNTDLTLSNFNFNYVYGLTEMPYKHSKEKQKFNTLFTKIIGDKGIIITDCSLHPYQLINNKGINIWQYAFIKTISINKDNNILKNIIEEKNRFFVEEGNLFKDYNFWIDNRLLPEENSFFKKFTPFIIPFLSYKESKLNETKLTWDIEKSNPIYIESINNDLHFLLPKPSFIIGLDEFKEDDLSHLVNNFIKIIY
jgi:hypothetical protein